MTAIFASILLLAGCAFALIAAIGVARMPDLFCRMHASTKAGAFGVSLILLALVVAAPGIRIFVQSVLIVAFFYLTAPVAAHMIGRAALLRGIRAWGIEKMPNSYASPNEGQKEPRQN